MKYPFVLILSVLFSISAFGATRGVSYDTANSTVIQTDLNQTFESIDVTSSAQRGGVDLVDANRLVSTGAGLSGGGSLAADRTLTLNPGSFVNSVTWWDGSQSSRTWTFSLSGATDPTWTISDGVMNLSAGTLQQGGVAVVTQSRTITIDGTAGEITSSAGAQSLAGDRVWTLSLPATLTFTGKTINNGTYATPTFSGTPVLADNVRWTFNPGANNSGLNVGSHAGDPNSPSNGDIWYDSNANELTARINGSNVALGAGGGGGSGDITGPATSTDNALALWDGTGGDTLQDSGITSNGSDLTIPGSIIITGPTPGLLSIITEGVTADEFELEITSEDPTADRTITFPDRSGTVVVTTDTADDGDALVWDNATGTWIASPPGAGSVDWDGIGDPSGSSVIALGTTTNQFTSSLDGAVAMSIFNTDADNAVDTTILQLAANDAADANTIFLDILSDADGTPTSLLSIRGSAFTVGLPSTFSAGLNTSGGLTLQTANDPDVSTEGGISWDANGNYLRVHDGTRQVAVRTLETIHVTVIAPNDLADAQRDAFIFWSNESGMPFVITGWKAWSGTDDTTLNIEVVDADGVGNNATVDAVEIATGSGPFTGSDTTITAATIASTRMLVLDFDDADTPTYVKLSITGYFDADVN